MVKYSVVNLFARGEVMKFSLTSDYKFDKLTDITAGFLRDRGIRLLLLDLDNTMSPYRIIEPTEELLRWNREMLAGGIRLFIVSNNRGNRPAVMADSLGIPYLNLAKKPSRRGIDRALSIENAEKEETALVGDQTFTDVLAANLAGITSILVEPIKFTNIFLRLRYWLEVPFRKKTRYGD